MLSFDFIQNNQKLIKETLKKRGSKFSLAKFLETAKKYHKALLEVEELRRMANMAAKARDIKKGRELKRKLAGKEKAFSQVEEIYNELNLILPNIVLSDVPAGGEKDFKILKTVGKPKKFSFSPKDHLELGEDLDIIDTNASAKVSGSRFFYLKNEGVILEFALIRFVLNKLMKKKFIPMITPQLINDEALTAGGFVPTGDEIYRTQDDLSLVGTSEQTLLGYHMKDTLEKLPRRYAGFSTCFRREAGSYGKDVRGILRTHQFDKIEMFSYVSPDDAKKEQDFLLKIEEEIVKDLGLPYRQVLLAAGDTAHHLARTIDTEVWLPAQKKYRETHSCSQALDYQSRRAKIKFKHAKGGTDFVHTLNGTAIAVGRIMIAILENHQKKDGSVTLPKALHKYTGFKTIKRK